MCEIESPESKGGESGRATPFNSVECANKSSCDNVTWDNLGFIYFQK